MRIWYFYKPNKRLVWIFKSNRFIQINVNRFPRRSFLNGQLDDVKKENVKIDFYDLLLSAESDILETLLYDIDKHKGDFFVTFRNADLPYNPMLEGQFPKEFKGKNVYSLAAKNINSLSYAKNEKRARNLTTNKKGPEIRVLFC